VYGAVQLRRLPGRYRYRPQLRGRLAWPLLRVGLPNHWLTLTERAPGLILPIVVTEVVSPAANAAWYAAWMMAWVVYIIPIQSGMTLFAEASHRPELLDRLIRQGVRQSLLLGILGAGVVALAAHPLLSILGPKYAEAGATPLRLLVLAVIPLVLVQAYFVFCRCAQLLREAIVVGVVAASLSIGAAAVAGLYSGLTGMALAWVGAQALSGAWALWRLRRLSRAARERLRAEIEQRELSLHEHGSVPEPVAGTGA
jgi:O-antigen/teichoic acid export membrane protein